jgi:mannose-6-phosphate isomerase-like protein (cupin superfamily)
MLANRAPHIVLPNEGELVNAAGDRYRFLATREVTDGKYGLWEAVVPPGGGPPPHLHTREEEGFYVVDGELAVYVDGVRVVAGPGSFVNMPVGSTHWFRNESDRPAKMLVLVAPGGMEGLFKYTGQAVADPASPIPPLGDEEKQRIVAAAPTFGIELKGH